MDVSLWRGGQARADAGHEFGAMYRVIKPGYFQTMRVAMRSGRDFAEDDNEQSVGIAIVNEVLANRQWPGESAIGKTNTLRRQHAKHCRRVRQRSPGGLDRTGGR